LSERATRSARANQHAETTDRPVADL